MSCSERRLRVLRPLTLAPNHLDALYLHARLPSDARVVFYDPEGAAAVRPDLPDELQSRLETVQFEALLPTEESTLRPIGAADARDDDLLTAARIVPGLWNAPGRGLSLADAIPWLAEQEPSFDQPGLCYLIQVAKFVVALVERGDFAPAEEKSVFTFVPFWNDDTAFCAAALAELTPGILLTGRFATDDEPVYAVTPRNLTVGLIGHGVDSLATARGGTPGHEQLRRLPDEFWRLRPQPVLQVLVPEKELEEGVRWGLQVVFRAVPNLGIHDPLEALDERAAHSLFPDPQGSEGIAELRAKLDEVATRVGALRRAINMAEGKASLDRAELDQLLDHLTMLESDGFVITLPGLEHIGRLSARVELIEETSEDLGPRPWFEFRWSVALGDEQLDEGEFRSLVDSRSPLVFLDRGPVLLTPKDREALTAIAQRVDEHGERISFFEALRVKLGGASHLHGLAVETVHSSPRLDELIFNLEQARELEPRRMPGGFIGELRPYQERGHAWMHFLVDQGFGACLADDMGLGKTVQAIAVMLDWRANRDPDRTEPILLVCPVSVLGNWRRELARFAPTLRTFLHHGKLRPREPADFAQTIRDHDVLLTSYSLLQRDGDLFLDPVWDGVILDEAQNIKNPSTRQSQAARSLKGRFRLALTGTPLENRPLDLWSIMDFLNEGLLGSRSSFLQTLEHPIVRQRSRGSASTLARLVRPFVLRRLKTDPEIITDLPEKSEQVVAASLTREQAIMYESVVQKGLTEVEQAAEGIKRRGAILTTLLRLKQVCNHPAHYLSDGSPLPNRSGKLDLLSEMVVEALEEGDRCLVFTQFKEMGTLLRTHLEQLIEQKVSFLHGGVPQKEREEMVNTFQAQDAESPRVFVLSLKAGGTGLNLTAANRVFHFDRWWNPAVEDQATDRAFRIGQQRNVFVHKFVCTGTLEERIQTMLEHKRDVANTLLAAGENWLTELSNDELRRLMMLDRQEAMT